MRGFLVIVRDFVVIVSTFVVIVRTFVVIVRTFVVIVRGEQVRWQCPSPASHHLSSSTTQGTAAYAAETENRVRWGLIRGRGGGGGFEKGELPK